MLIFLGKSKALQKQLQTKSVSIENLQDIQLWKEQHATEEHPFVTTLHVINSAILKLSRVQPAEKVFRGNQGGVLPKEFWIPNKDNIRGGIELGFLSTTKDRCGEVLN